jgi:hypothetical protein
MTEIQRADPKIRRRVLAITIVGALIGAVLLMVFTRFRPELIAWLEGSGSGRARLGIVLAVMAVLGCAPLLGLAVFLALFGNRVIRDQRFPPPGSLVVRDTPVLRDSAAIRRGRLFEAFAAAFALAALGLLFALWRLWSLFPESP